MAPRRALLCVTLAPLIATGCAFMHDANPYAGVWVLKYQRRNLLSFSLESSGKGLQGTMVRPRALQFDQDGWFSEISNDPVTDPLINVVQAGKELTFSTGSGENVTRFSMRLVDAMHAEVRLSVDHALPPWRLERVTSAKDARLAADWPRLPQTPELIALRADLKRMTEEDQAVRPMNQPFSGSRAEPVDRAHRDEVLRIFNEYSWPKVSLVGKEASRDFWLLVQHQSQDVQERLLPELKRAVESGEAAQSNYAMLYDRVMSGQGKLQRWGTQTVCVDGRAQLAPVEDPGGLDERRRTLNMPPITDYLRTLSPTCPVSK
jgi:hypothetical protein